MKILSFPPFVKGRSRSDGSHWLTEWTLADLIDVTLVIEDDEDDEDDEYQDQYVWW